MIFVTTGTQLPFDRLIDSIDKIACRHTNLNFVIQVCNYETITVKSNNVKLVGFLEPQVFQDYFDRSTLIIGHAGMGTIIGALEVGKPLIVFPRKVEFKEHRNDHQLATVGWLSKLNLVKVAFSQEELETAILNAFDGISNTGLSPVEIGASAPKRLINEIRMLLQ